MSDLANELWSTLPPEIVERMLSFLSVPVLCRFRTVCKRWNSLICKPEFGALCIQHARQDAYFIVLRYAIRSTGADHRELGSFGVNHGWSFLDVSARRCYTIKHDGQEVFDSFKTGGMGMDGGLVYQHMQVGDEDASIFVSNPIAMTSRRLPPCTVNYGDLLPDLNMIVDNIAHSYKVFVMPTGAHGVISADQPLMVVYESTTNQWRNTTILQTPLLGFHFHVLCNVFLNGLLYVLMSPYTAPGSVQDNCLWSYNPVEDVWKNTCVNIQYRPLRLAALVVIDNRLHLKALVHYGHAPTDHPLTWSPDGWSFEISEVLLEDRTHKKVFEMMAAVGIQVFQVPNFANVSLDAIGFGKSIVLLCKESGISILYVLNSSLWELLPAIPLVLLQGEGYQIMWHGRRPMNLILPQWDQQHETESAGDILGVFPPYFGPCRNHGRGQMVASSDPF